MTTTYNDKCHKEDHDFKVNYTMVSTVDINKMPTTNPKEVHITFTDEFVTCTKCTGIYSRHSKVYS